MAGFGPPPKPEEQQRRLGRNLAANTSRLPAEGRAGDPPAWPLPRPIKRELALWARLWATPQAVAWERLGWVDTVARYARQLVRAEGRDAQVTILSEVRQLEDRLGLTPMAMLRLRWEIAPSAAGSEEGAAPADELDEARKRLRPAAGDA
jgi:hypothetical protein